MSQRYVERVIGLLATDEALRRSFQNDPLAALHALLERGMELTPCELRALAAIDSTELARFADAIDPRIQRSAITECEI